ncbi:hypothetical protein DdX_21627 [Ditylenchus destructor]|uniref:Uncharacterized protein n=1 Tax=Ditylenchus destructor TaxID=166010 RepID=A0AAD4MF93_9BILA|nr:hypothetical protein DdX_21627 [Ditylenchus destructor]
MYSPQWTKNRFKAPAVWSSDRGIVTVLTHFEPSQAFMVSHRLMQRSTPFAQLRDFAPPALKDSQNFPALSTQAMVTLHAPVPFYM